MVPGPGPAADCASARGDVLTGFDAALLVPRSLLDAARVPAFLRRQARAVREAVRSTGAELVIVSSALMPGALAGARQAGAGVVLYSAEPLMGSGGRGLATRAIARFAGWRSDWVLACSRLLADSYGRSGVKAAVLYPPIEAPGDSRALAERGAELRGRLGISAGERMVCSLGAITEGRGQDTLIEALAASTPRGDCWRLVIAGEPYERPLDVAFADRLHTLASKLGLGDRIAFPGRIDDVNALYAATDLFVNPARVAEAFGRVACEALAAGAPVVSTRVGGTAEALRDGETALLVEPDSPPALATAIERLLDDRALAERLARAGAEDVAHRFAPALGEPVFNEAVKVALAARASRLA
jgi:glycosyltransferase involved in cell wall biosynthesis